MVTRNIHVGDTIEVIATDNVLRRFPNLVGVHGVIETTPVHPNIWYTIYFKCLDATLKLQQNAVKLHEKRSGDSKNKTNAKSLSPIAKEKEKEKQKSNVEDKKKFNNKVTVVKSKGSLSVDVDAKAAGSGHINPSPCVVPVSYLKVGTRVMILGTENVLHRAPEIEGSIGIIKEAPVHPTTWFKVQVPDDDNNNNNVYTLRPSALRPVNSDGSLIPLPIVSCPSPASQTSHTPARELPTTKTTTTKTAKSITTAAVTTTTSAADTNKSLKSETEVQLSTSDKPRLSGKKSAVLLSTLDPDLWEQQEVLVMGGKFDGHSGRVASSGNGWVQVMTSLGEVAKRAYELQVINNNNNNSAQRKLVKKVFRPPTANADAAAVVIEKPVVTSLRARPTRDKLLQQQQQQQPQQQQPQEESVPTATQQGVTTTTTARSQATRATVPQKSSEPLVGQKRTHQQQQQQQQQPQHKVSFPPADKMTTDTNIATTTSTTTAFQPLKFLKSDPFLEAKRVFVAKYVAKQQQKLKSRPHLSNWKHQMDAVIYNNNPSIELQAARDFEDSYCDVCCCEKWPGAKFCWNELCAVSPIYFRLSRKDEETNFVISPISPSKLSPRNEHNNNNNYNSNSKNNNNNNSNNKKSMYSFSDIQPNPVTSFLLQAPVVVLSANTEKFENNYEEANNNSNNNNNYGNNSNNSSKVDNILNCEETFDSRNKTVIEFPDQT